MRIEGKWLFASLVVIAVLIVGSYELGRRKTENTKPAEVATQTSTQKPVSAPQKAYDAKPQPESVGPAQVTSDIKGKFTHFRVGRRNVKDIYADGKLIWVGFSGGLIRYDTSNDQSRLFDTKSGLMSNGVFHVSKLGDRIAVGTYGGGLSLYDKRADKWETLNIPDGLGDAFIYDALETSWGEVWIATWSGANRVRSGKLNDRSKWDLFTVENTNGGLPNDWVYGLAEGANGEVWFATEGGLARYKDGQWTNWTHEQGLGAPYEKVKDQIKFKHDPGQFSSHHAQQKVEQGLEDVDVAYNPNYIVSLLVDKRDGAVWAGTWGGGLSRFDGSEWKVYTMDDGLPANHIFMLYQDKNGAIWIGTSDGLVRFEDDKFTVYTKKDGLLSNNVFSMAIDMDENLWIGSFGGVAKLEKGILN